MVTGSVERRFIVAEVKAHPDDMWAIYLVKWEAASIWRDAPVIFVDPEKDLPELRRQYGRSNLLEIGIGGGRFDEHRPDAPKGSSASSLIAEWLGLTEDPEYKRYNEYFRARDAGEPGKWFEISAFLKRTGEIEEDTQKVWSLFTWWMDTVRAKGAGVRCVGEWNAEIHDAPVAEFVSRIRGFETMRVALVRSDVREAQLWGMSPEGGNWDVVICIRSTGNVQIYGRRVNGRQLDMRPLALAWRLEEYKLRTGKDGDWRQLEVPKMCKEVPNIFLLEGVTPKGHLEYPMILNGSDRHPSVEPTLVSGERLLELAQECFKPLLAECAEGCWSMPSNPCNRYCLGRKDCRYLRGVARSDQQSPTDVALPEMELPKIPS